MHQRAGDQATDLPIPVPAAALLFRLQMYQNQLPWKWRVITFLWEMLRFC